MLSFHRPGHRASTNALPMETNLSTCPRIQRSTYFLTAKHAAPSITPGLFRPACLTVQTWAIRNGTLIGPVKLVELA